MHSALPGTGPYHDPIVAPRDRLQASDRISHWTHMGGYGRAVGARVGQGQAPPWLVHSTAPTPSRSRAIWVLISLVCPQGPEIGWRALTRGRQDPLIPYTFWAYCDIDMHSPVAGASCYSNKLSGYALTTLQDKAGGVGDLSIRGRRKEEAATSSNAAAPCVITGLMFLIA